MDIYGAKVCSSAFGFGVITEQSETTVTVDFNGVIKKFLYPSGFESYLVLEDPALQTQIHSEIASAKALLARRQRVEMRRAMMQAERDKADAKKTGRKK